MFFVLVLHSQFFTFGIPVKEKLECDFFSSFSSFFIESIGIVSVNVFILISGWFRITPKLKGFSSFIFQCLFFYTLIYFVTLLLDLYSFNYKDIANIFLLTDWNWFVLAYLGLYILSPILNRFLENSEERQIGYFLITFFLFQTVYSWLSGAAKSFVAGYSTLSFVGLYVLAAYVKMICSKNIIRISAMSYLILYLTTMFIHALIAILLVWIGYTSLIPKWYSYINPICVISSLCLFLCFSRISCSSNFINNISISCFSVFLLHFNPWLTQSYFCKYIRLLYNSMDGIAYFFSLFLFLIIVFLLAILIDKVRIQIWNKIVKICKSLKMMA